MNNNFDRNGRQMPPRNTRSVNGRAVPPASNGTRPAPGTRQMPGSQNGQRPASEVRTAAGRQIPGRPANGMPMPGTAVPQRPAQGTRQVPSGQRVQRPVSRSTTVRNPDVSDGKRKATREQMRADNSRRRKEKMKTFLARLALYGIVLAVLGGVSAAVFFGFFYSTPDKNEPKIIFLENYTGTTKKTEVSGAVAYRGETLYLNFSSLAEGCDMSEIYDSKTAKFVLPDLRDTSDSAGTGKEEYVTFEKDSTECTVSGEIARLSSPCVFRNKDVWVPADFVTTYIKGITVTEDRRGGSVTVERDFAEDGTASPITFLLKAATPPEGTSPDEDTPVTGIPQPVFLTDLSYYEEYMNPADNRPYLILVNRQSTVDGAYLPENLTAVTDTRKDGRATQQMQLAASKALEAMFIEMRAAGFTDVSVTSAYRSFDYQKELYWSYVQQEKNNNPALTDAQAQAIVDTYSAREGTSEHQTGLCADLHNLPSATTAFAKEKAYAWLTENAWQFGFILRFPEGKEEITGYSFEPWHYRFVGRRAAWEIRDRGITLEEYLAENG